MNEAEGTATRVGALDLPRPADLGELAWRLGVVGLTAAVGAFVLFRLNAWPPHEDETLALFTGRGSLHELIETVLGQRGGAPLHFVLAWIVIRGHALSWPRGELTAIVGLTAFVLIAYNGVVDKPQDGLEISLAFGYWLALLASVGIFISGGFRAVESGGGAQRKPPATF